MTRSMLMWTSTTPPQSRHKIGVDGRTPLLRRLDAAPLEGRAVVQQPIVHLIAVRPIPTRTNDDGLYPDLVVQPFCLWILGQWVAKHCYKIWHIVSVLLYPALHLSQSGGLHGNNVVGRLLFLSWIARIQSLHDQAFGGAAIQDQLALSLAVCSIPHMVDVSISFRRHSTATEPVPTSLSMRDIVAWTISYYRAAIRTVLGLYQQQTCAGLSSPVHGRETSHK